MSIPFMNLKRQNAALREELLTAAGRVIDHGAFIQGPEVKAFEAAYAAFQGTAHCVACSNGTSALHLALAAAGVGPGDEVITVPNSFVATAEAVLHCGARPVFVDVQPDTLLMDPLRVEAAITPRTRALLPVHLYGCLAPMDELCAIARKHNLLVLEDAAQAQGAELHGKRAGSFGLAAGFSFYPGKNLGALGDAGAVVTSDEALAERMRLLRNHGAVQKYWHEIPGYNYRMDSLTAAFLSVKLPHLERWTETRRARAALYAQELAGSGLVLPVEPSGARHVWYVYAVRTGRRDELAAYLKERGIDTVIHYPLPIHLQKAFTFLGYGPGDFPVAERSAQQVLSLPLCADITEDEVRQVCAAVHQWAGR